MKAKRGRTPDATEKTQITLHFTADRVLVEPRDGDRFLLSAAKAIDACRHADRLEAAAREQADREVENDHRFEQTFLRPIWNWCQAHAGRVAACYVPVPAGFMEVYVVGRSLKYDFALGDDLARLELELVDAGWRVHTMLVPTPEDEDGLRAHFDYDGALEIYADTEPAPGQG